MMLHLCDNTAGTDSHTNNAFWREKIEPDSENREGSLQNAVLLGNL